MPSELGSGRFETIQTCKDCGAERHTLDLDAIKEWIQNARHRPGKSEHSSIRNRLLDSGVRLVIARGSWRAWTTSFGGRPSVE